MVTLVSVTCFFSSLSFRYHARVFRQYIALSSLFDQLFTGYLLQRDRPSSVFAQAAYDCDRSN